jgi:hypothetical protein
MDDIAYNQNDKGIQDRITEYFEKYCETENDTRIAYMKLKVFLKIINYILNIGY